MKNVDMARDYMFRAKRCLREADLALGEKDGAGTVRRSQEALELATKAVLRYLAIEYPREHDVGDALTFVAEKLPNYLRNELPRVRQLMTELARVRGPAFYGYEREGIPSSTAFSEEYATKVHHQVGELVNLCSDFLAGED